ncbi:TPR repeat region-containing protein, partial [Nocardia seriolae]
PPARPCLGLVQIPTTPTTPSPTLPLPTPRPPTHLNTSVVAVLKGVADTQAIAKIISHGDAQYKAGSAVDRELLDAGRRYLAAQNAYEQAPGGPNSAFFSVDGKGTDDRAITEGIFAAVGDDKVTVESVVTDKEHGKQFVTDVLTHNWTDDGKSALSMFRFGDQDATVENPADAQDVLTANRTGHIMSVVGEAMSTKEAWATLSNVPGTDNQSVGPLNPDLMRTISHSMAPYTADLAGLDQPDKPGFDTYHNGKSWIDPTGNNSYSGSANVFAVMNTDPEAGKYFNSAVLNQILNAESQFAKDPTAPNSGKWLSTAGTLHGLLDKGLQLETIDEYHDQDKAAEAAYKQKVAAYDVFKASVNFASGYAGDFAKFTYWGMNSGGDAFKEAMIGPKPEGHSTPELHGVNFDRDYQQILAFRQDTYSLPTEFQRDFPWAFGADGKLLTYDQAMQKFGNNPQELKGYEAMFARLGGQDGNGNMMRNSYTDVVRKDG